MHKQFLLAALQQAYLGRGRCSPNPSVGAVAVHMGSIIAQAFHHGAGTLHAEQLVLKQLPKKKPDITLYVTLEPCNHWGRTPPCVEGIIKQGIKRVIFAYADPNPVIIANNTPQLLRDQGIEVLHYPLPEITAFYQSYYHWTVTKMPWVTAKIAQSMDGKIAGASGAPVAISNALCHAFTHQNRLHTDIILTTARTIKQDDPALNVRLSDIKAAKPVAIIDSQATLSRDAKILTTAKHCHIYHDERVTPPYKHSNASYHGIPAKDDKLNLTAVLQHLGHLGFHDVWVEAGGVLFNALHQARLVNKTYIYIAPMILGDSAVSAYTQRTIFNRDYTLTWQAMGDNMIAAFEWIID